jgi:hypothetical protein
LLWCFVISIFQPVLLLGVSSTIKKPKSTVLPAEILVSSTIMAGGAADFSAEVGVSSTIKKPKSLAGNVAVLDVVRSWF